ncbi:hypothetical protein [Endozoicomonas atrinae]|uniref:hypothetical protein n=1 Tax=Endozoicomonas atrinae TaxID=1333660 RepID=UPI003B00943C
MSEEKFKSDLIRKIISLHDEFLNEIPESSLDLYENADAVMWDGYIEPIQELNEAIGKTFRLNKNIEEIDVGKAYESGGIEKLNLPQLGFVFRDILVNEKFNQGLFASVIMDGRVSRLVNRLKVLSENQC